MKLLREEYERGLLRWEVEDPDVYEVSFATTTSASPSELSGAPLEASSWLTDPSGSRVTSPPERYMRLGVRCNRPDAEAKIKWVIWEREQRTMLWKGNFSAPPRKLSFVPNVGTFHRLVTSVPDLGWPQDVVLRVGEVVIRFVVGVVHGERVTPMDKFEVTEDGKGHIVGGSVGATTVQGRFVEIVAPGASRVAAKERAWGILGLVALAVGDQAIGDTVFSESYEVTDQEQLGQLEIPVSAAIPFQAKESNIDTIDFLLPWILGDERRHRSRTLALRWYQKGLADTDPVDQFFAFFIGMETIVNSFAADHGPLPEVRERHDKFEAEIKVGPAITTEEKALLLQRLSEATLTERFRFYVQRHGLPKETVGEFRSLNQTRREAFHGSISHIDHGLVSSTRGLLLRLLKADLGLLGKVPAEETPLIRSLGLEYALLDDDRPPKISKKRNSPRSKSPSHVKARSKGNRRSN